VYESWCYLQCFSSNMSYYAFLSKYFYSYSLCMSLDHKQYSSPLSKHLVKPSRSKTDGRTAYWVQVQTRHVTCKHAEGWKIRDSESRSLTQMLKSSQLLCLWVFKVRLRRNSIELRKSAIIWSLSCFLIIYSIISLLPNQWWQSVILFLKCAPLYMIRFPSQSVPH